MAHRKTQQEAEELKVEFEQNYPSCQIAITPHARGGFMVREVRECEECKREILTAAIGEIEMGGNFCQSCKIKVYAQRRQERESEAAIRNAEDQAYYDAEAWYYAEEG